MVAGQRTPSALASSAKQDQEQPRARCRRIIVLMETIDLMQNITLVLRHGLVYGAILSAVMSLSFLGLAYLNPEVWTADYPPDIREKFGPMSERAKKQRRLAGVPVFLLLFGILVLSAVELARIDGGSTFLAVFLGAFVVLLVFNVVDLLILDWLIFVTIRPEFVVLPGTEGMQGYRDYGFHFRAFLKGVAGSLIASLIVARSAVVIGAIVT